MIGSYKNKGFSLIEILLVLAITAILLGISISAINSTKNYQYSKSVSDSIVSLLNSTENLAVNSVTENINSPITYGYLFSLNQQKNGYCIYKLIDANDGSPTSLNFSYSGNLQYVLDNTSGFTLDIPLLSTCSGFIDKVNGVEYQLYSQGNFSRDTNLVISWKELPIGGFSNNYYIAYENLTGTGFVFGSTGVYIQPSHLGSLSLNVAYHGTGTSVTVASYSGGKYNSTPLYNPNLIQ